MIRFQIVERAGAGLHKTLVKAMRNGDLRTFFVRNRGRKVQHTSLDYPGWMNWASSDGVITCEVISPRKPGEEWKFFSALLGRLADRFANDITAINVQFPSSSISTARVKRKRSQRNQSLSGKK